MVNANLLNMTLTAARLENLLVLTAVVVTGLANARLWNLRSAVSTAKGQRSSKTISLVIKLALLSARCT